MMTGIYGADFDNCRILGPDVRHTLPFVDDSGARVVNDWRIK